MPQRNEKKLVDRGRKYLNSLEDSFCFKTHGSPMQMQGVSDLILCYHGKYYALEFKDPQNKEGPTPTQEEFMRKVKRAGGEAYVVRSLAALKKRFT